MNFNDLLQSKDIDPERVLVLRHRPWEEQLNRVLPWLAAERPDLFNAYQQTQGERVEAALKRTSHVAAFIRRESGQALFVGLYTVKGSTPITRRQFWHNPAHVELKALGMAGFTQESPRRSILFFDLARTDIYASWSGKLVVGWPPPERSWWRWAHRNTFPVVAILEDSAFDAAMPPWDTLEFNWEDLRVLPTRWKAALSQWRGVYYIFDMSDAKGYVGSAYGDDNLFGRWRDYAARGHGGNRLLRHRDPRNFRFTILQRVSPDTDPAEVIRIEGSWKRRLHTHAPHGLNEN